VEVGELGLIDDHECDVAVDNVDELGVDMDMLAVDEMPPQAHHRLTRFPPYLEPSAKDQDLSQRHFCSNLRGKFI
jgi:hypothetical protein